MSTIDLTKLERLGQGRAAEVFALDDERVVKVARGDAGPSLDREMAALSAAHRAGVPVPTPFEITTIDGRRALIMSRVRGTDMLSLFASRPWTLLSAGGRLGELHARLHETIAPTELPGLREVLDQRIAESDRVPEPIRERAVGLVRELPEEDKLCHLDFHPANVLVNGSELVVIDWPGACRGDPLADVACTALALTGGVEPPGTPWLTRAFAPAGRKLLLNGYLRGYRRQSAIQPSVYARWQIVAAVNRLTYDIAGEAEMLMRMIDELAARI